MRAIRPGVPWKESPLKWAFWLLNIGLGAMAMLSRFPIGMMQTVASIQRGTWYARSAEFLQTPAMQTLRWMRVPGDVLFASGCVILGLFVVGLFTGHSYQKPLDTNIRVEGEEKEHVLMAGD